MNLQRFRWARADDGAAVAAMCRRLTEHQGDGVSAFTAEQFAADGFAAVPRFRCILAEREGEAVGYVLFHPEYNTDLMQRSAYLVDLYVEPWARRHGVGQRLMAASAKAAAADGAALLSWSVKRTNATARAFYRRVGREQPELFYGVASDERLDRLAATRAAADIRLRPASAEDVPLLARFIAELLRATGGEPPAEIEAPLRRDGFGRDPAFAAILAEDGGRPLGHALYWPCYDTEHAARGVFLSDLYVEPSARRRGVALALMGEVARRACARGSRYAYWQIWEPNAAAIAFYAPIAIEDRAAMPCIAEGAEFRALVAAAPELAPDGRG